MVEVSSDSSSDDDSLMERIKGRKVLATPAVRRIAMENKVQISESRHVKKLSSGFPIKSDTKRTVQPQKMARCLQSQI